jgi:hypothetical protein
VSSPWVPGAGSEEELVRRVHAQIERFAEQAGVPQAVVELQLRDGSLFTLDSVAPGPGFGFVTIRPHPEEGELQQELILPLGSIARIVLSPAEEHRERFGFTLPGA